MCTALAFLCQDDVPKQPSDVDALIDDGTRLYNDIGLDKGGMTIAEVPSCVCMRDNEYKLSFRESRGGLVAQNCDDNDSLTFCVKSALCSAIEEACTLIVTLGSATGSTVAIKKTGNVFVAFDSHSRDETGMCTPDGKAVVIQLSSLNAVLLYIKELASSISSDVHVPFEITAVSITV